MVVRRGPGVRARRAAAGPHARRTPGCPVTPRAVDADGWIRAVGYHDSVAGALDRHRLDELSPPVPVRVQHRSGALWTLNSAALAAHRRARSPRRPVLPGGSGCPACAGPVAAADSATGSPRFGVTGVTEATPDYGRRDIETFTQARRSGELRQHLHCMAVAGTRPTAEVSVGPAKIILDDTTLDLDALRRWIADNHAAGQPVAVHCRDRQSARGDHRRPA